MSDFFLIVYIITVQSNKDFSVVYNFQRVQPIFSHVNACAFNIATWLRYYRIWKPCYTIILRISHTCLSIREYAISILPLRYDTKTV